MVLRQVETGDAASLYRHFATLQGDRFWDLRHRSEEDARQHIDLIHNWYREQRLLWWAITMKNESDVIGSCSLYDFEGESRAEIGYWVSTLKQGNGVATEAVRRVLHFGFGDMGLHRIQASCHPENHPALSVVEKAGFQREGLLRQYEPGSRGWRDCVMFSVIKSDRVSP